MARKPKPVDIGHNSLTITRDDKKALARFHTNQILSAEPEIERLRGELKGAIAVQKKAFNIAKGDGFPRHMLEREIADLKKPITVVQDEEEIRAILREANELPVGTQMALNFDNTPQEAKDEIFWKAAGYRAGLRGIGAQLPEGIPPRMDQPYLDGYYKGQEENIMLLAKGREVSNRLRGLGVEPDAETEAEFADDGDEAFEDDHNPLVGSVLNEMAGEYGDPTH